MSLGTGFFVKKKELNSQLLFFISCIIYAISLNFVHSTYLLESQEFWGYTYFPLGLTEYIIIFFGILMTSLVTPIDIDRPSSIILYTIYIVIIIPTLVITIGLEDNAINIYGLILFSLISCYFIIGSVCSLTIRLSKRPTNYHYPNVKTEYFFVFLWIVFFFTLLFLFRDVINFVGLEDIYTQRAAGKSRNLFEGYMQTYLPSVVCAALMAFGLAKKNYLQVGLAVAGYGLMFGIDAQRSIFLTPFILYALYRYLKSDNSKKNMLVGFNIFVSSIFVLVGLLPNGVLREFLGFYIVTRIFATPGIMVSLYHEVFSQTSYTYWSHIKGINLIVPKPIFFSGDQDWPQLGYIVANYALGIDSNSNAHLFAADGVAAAGALGVIVISIIFLFYLILLDYFSRNIEPMFKVIVAFPIGLALTNGSLATILLSFGGLFWLLFYFYTNTKRLK